MNPAAPSTRILPERPDLDQLRRQAKELCAAFRAGEPAAVAEVNARYRGADPAAFALHEAQLVLARSYGFDSWPKLKARVDGVTAARLCAAVERGDAAAARAMLVRRPELVDMEWPGHGELRALHVAVLRRDAALVRLLMEHGADARRGVWPHRDATSALTFATERGQDEIVAILHTAERARAGDARGSGAGRGERELELERVLRTGAEDRAVALLEAEAGLVASSDPNGWTFLHHAAGRLRARVVEWLLARGADVNRRAKGGWTPLELAASGRDWDGTGAPERFAAVARALLSAGAELGPLSAVALGDAEWVRARHAAGALATPAEFELFAPFGGLLTAAVRHERPEMLRLLLDLGLDPDERARVAGSDGTVHTWGMPLFACAEAGDLALAELLLERGADPNGQVLASGTPVGVAYGRRDRAMVALLERHGGVIYAANAGYYRDAELARRLLADEAAGTLRPGTVEPGTTVAEALLASGATGGDPEIVRLALERIAWPRDDPRWFWRLWDALCFWNHMPGIPTADPRLERGTYLACFRLVLERCDSNLRAERFGQTILHEVAAMRAHVSDAETVAFATALLDAGARWDVRDALLSSTPLGWACRWGRAGLVRLLLERGADPVEAGAEPWARPRAWAEKRGHGAVLAVLREHGQ